jgi:hypothetical protein
MIEVVLYAYNNLHTIINVYLNIKIYYYLYMYIHIYIYIYYVWALSGIVVKFLIS